MLYNQGNGPLVIEDVTLTYPDERDVWRFTLEGLPSFPYQIDTRDLLVLNLGWQAPYTEAISIPCEATLSVSYLNPYSQALETRELEVAQVFNNPTFNVELMRGDGQGPVAVGTEVWLDASQSSVSISSAYALYLFSYQWYLIDKPAGSWAKLNKSWGDLQAFSPDLPGDYTVELIVTAYSENFLSVAEPTQLTITAQ